MMLGGCGAAGPQRTPESARNAVAGQTTGRAVNQRERESSKDAPVGNRALDQMLNERNQRGRPSIPGYKLVREAEEAVERQQRIYNVLQGRMRRAQKHREFGKIACLRRDIEALRRLLNRSSTEAREIEVALRGRDRAKAEELWLRVRVFDMQAREHIHKRCKNEAHVEVEMTGPGGIRRFSGQSPKRGQ